MDIELSKLCQALQDAGFNAVEREEFLYLYEHQELIDQCECLAKKRKKLLDKVHQKEKQINRLDYLQYVLEKGIEKK